MEDPFVRLLMGLIALGVGGLVAWVTVSVRRDQREILRLQRRATDDIEGVASHTERLRRLADEAEARRAAGERAIRERRGVLAELATVADEAAARRAERERIMLARRGAALIDARPTDTLRSPRGIAGDEDDVLPRR